jgi:leucyl aminopeptidase
MSEVLIAAADAAIPVHLLTETDCAAYLQTAPAPVTVQAERHGFKGKAGQVLAVVSAEGQVERVLAGLGTGEPLDAMVLRALPAKLTAADYRFEALPPGLDPLQAAIAFGLGSYRFDRYKPAPDARPRLVSDQAEAAQAVVHACALARDMVNTPANDMGPLQIETIAREIAEQYGGRLAVITGDDLLEENYPAIHAVGRSATVARAPRMIELSWSGKPGSGDAGEDLPLVALVGKGVVFDTGGLDIKPSAGMRAMKKDMGGAAHALALGRMVMAAKLPVRLVVLLPVAENAISAEAMRPGDVLNSRQGLTIEVGNTDAEGRLILADALTRAGELQPDLTIDLATLTGAARVALGPQVVPFYTPDDALAAALAVQGATLSDPLWRMPLWKPYAEAVESDIADLKNDPDAWAQAGSITAALFLQRFAPASGAWIHLDIFAWNGRAQPGRPAGGEAQAIRALMGLLTQRYG